MIKDPREIITPYAFQVHPDLLGLPLATPKRRLAALLIDLVIASVLTGLGNVFLAFGVTVIFFWVAVRTRGENLFYNLLRYASATVGSIFVFVIAIGIIEGMDPSDNDTTDLDELIAANAEDIDFGELGKQMGALNYSNADSLELQIEQMVEDLGFAEQEVSVENFIQSMPESFPTKLAEFERALNQNDTLATDSLREVLAPILASVEITSLKNKNTKLGKNNITLQDEIDDLTEQIEHPSLYNTLKKWFGYMGLSLGWIGIYFIASVAYFKGQTLGKRFLKLRIVRLNNNPLSLYFAFERFGGYAAGVATGLIGFFQMFWDANRQAIHDKIAGTVVIDLRESKIRKTESYRKEILDEENLLS